MRPDTYYRIELPNQTPEDLELIEGLKKTLGEVLFYERTACPFRRGDCLPELDEMTRPRRTLSRADSVKAKKWRFERTWKPEGDDGAEADEDEDDGDWRAASRSRQSSVFSERTVQEEDEDSQDLEQDQDLDLGVQKPSLSPSHLAPRESRPTRSVRAVTAPPELIMRSIAPPSPKVPQIAGRINEINEATRRRDESGSTLTPVRRSSQMYDALPPRLPPTPESLKNDFGSGGTEEDEEHKDHFDSKGTEEGEEHKTGGRTSDDKVHSSRHSEDPNDEVAEMVATDSANINLKAPLINVSTADDATMVESLPLESPPIYRSTTPPAVVYSSPPPNRAADLSQSLCKSPLTSIQNQTWQPQQPSPTPSISQPPPPSVTDSQTHSRTPSSSFDDAQDRLSPSHSRNPSVTSSNESWTSLPTTTSLQASNEPPISLHTLSHLHPLVPHNDQQQQQKRHRAPSTSQLIAQTSAMVVRRTASLFLGPPAHLVALMLRIAARFVAGTADSMAYGVSVVVDDDPDQHQDGQTQRRGHGHAHSKSVELEELASVGMSRGRDGAGGAGGTGGGGVVARRRFGANADDTGPSRFGHRRLPGSFDWSDDEEEWGGM